MEVRWAQGRGGRMMHNELLSVTHSWKLIRTLANYHKNPKFGIWTQGATKNSTQAIIKLSHRWAPLVYEQNLSTLLYYLQWNCHLIRLSNGVERAGPCILPNLHR